MNSLVIHKCGSCSNKKVFGVVSTALPVILAILVIVISPVSASGQTEIELISNPDFSGNLNDWTRSIILDETYPRYNLGDAQIFNSAGIGEFGTAMLEQTFSIPAIASSVSMSVNHWSRCSGSRRLEIYINDHLVHSVTSDNGAFVTYTYPGSILDLAGVTPGSSPTVKFKGYALSSGVETSWVASVNIKATMPPARAVSGTVTDTSSDPVSGVTISVTGDQTTSTTTASDGTFSVDIYEGNSITLTPSHSGYSSFSPATRSMTVSDSAVSGQDFVGTPNLYTVSGVVEDSSGSALSGIGLTMTGDRSGSTSSDGSGAYSFSAYYGEQINISISDVAYTFSPTNRNHNISGNQVNQDYVGTLKPYSISGTLLYEASPISGATLTFSHNGGTTTTDASGNYSYSVNHGTSTTVTPSHSAYHGWSPTSRSFSDVTADQPDQDFSGVINTYTITGTVSDGANPLAGVTLTFSHDSGTTTSAANGTYSYTVDYGTTTTVAPTHTGYHGWSPTNRTLSNIASNQSSNDFQGTINSYNVTGNITDGTDPLAGVTLTFSHNNGTTTTDASGNYSYAVDYGTTTTVTPSHEGYHGWTPENRTLTNVTSNQTNQDFSGVINTYTISGTVSDGANPLAGVTLTFSHDSGTTTSGANGTYSYTVDYRTTTTVAPTHTGYHGWSPANRTLSNIASNQSSNDFQGTVNTYSVAGNITDGTAPLAGVTVTFSHNNGTTTTDASGNYSYAVDYGTTTTVTPSHEGYHGWTPENRTLTNVISDQPDQNFQGIINTYDISGNVTDGTDSLAGVTLTFSHDNGTTSTDSSGNYSYTVDYNTTTTLTPEKVGYTVFAPATLDLSNIKENQTAKNFLGTIDTYEITGNVTDGTDPLPGVTLTFSHDSGTTTTDSSGNYSYTVDHGTTTTVTPSHEGYHGWVPENRTLTDIASDQPGQDFHGTINTYEISGNVTDDSGPIEGATINFSHDSGSTTTDSFGNYTYTVDYNTATTLTPERVGYSVWTPASLDLSAIKGNQQDKDFQGTIDTFTVSGNIEDETGVPMEGVSISFNSSISSASASASWQSRTRVITASSSSATVTDASGNYSFVLEYGSQGKLIPSKTNYDFTPVEITVEPVVGDLGDQDFVGDFAVGDLKVYLEPAGATDSGAVWRRAGTTVWYRSGQVETEIPHGDYYVEFSEVEGWIIPESQRVTIVKKEVTTTTGTYEKEILTGSLTVSFEPDDSALDPARWSIEGSNVWNVDGAKVDEVEVGTVTVLFKDVQGWETPDKVTVEIKEDQTATATGTYKPLQAMKPEIHYFTVDPEIAAQGDPVTLAWDVRDADTVVIDNGIGEVELKGSLETIMEETVTYRLTAENTFGENIAALTAEKVEKASIHWFTSSNPPGNPCSIESEALLTWSIAGADSAGIDLNGDGEADISVDPEGGELSVKPDAEGSVYTLIASNVLSDVIDTTEVAVTTLPEIKELVSTPDTVLEGVEVTLTWDVTGADKLTIEPGIGEVQGSSYAFKPEASGTYTLTAENVSGSVSAEVEITVVENTNAPDLLVTFGNIGNPAEAKQIIAGEPISVQAVVENTGTRVARKFFVTLERVGNQVVIATRKIRTLKAGEKRTIAFVYSPPNAGKHLLKIGVDKEGIIAEFDEANNNARKEISVIKAQGVDLLVADVNVRKAGKGTPDEAIKISFSIANAGRVISDSFQYKVFLTNRNKLTMTKKSVLLTEDHLEKLRGNRRVNITLTTLLPDHMLKSFYLVIQADVYNAVDEINLKNNNFISRYLVKELK